MGFILDRTSLTSSIEFAEGITTDRSKYNFDFRKRTAGGQNISPDSFNTVLKTDQIAYGARFSTLISMGRVEADVSNLKPIVIDNRVLGWQRWDAILPAALFTIPNPLPGSSNKKGPTSGATLEERGALACYSRGKDVDVEFRIQRCTLDGLGGITLIGDVSYAQSTHGSSYDWEGAAIVSDPAGAPSNAPFLYYPTGSEPGDLYRLQISARASGSGAPGFLDALLVFEPPLSDTKP